MIISQCYSSFALGRVRWVGNMRWHFLVTKSLNLIKGRLVWGKKSNPMYEASIVMVTSRRYHLIPKCNAALCLKQSVTVVCTVSVCLNTRTLDMVAKKMYTPWHGGTVVSMWTAFLPLDKSDKFQRPGGVRSGPGGGPGPALRYVFI